MNFVAGAVPVAKKKPDNNPPDPSIYHRPRGETNVTVKVWSSIHRQAKLVAYQLDVDISDLISALLQKPIAEAYKKAVAQITEDAKSEENE